MLSEKAHRILNDRGLISIRDQWFEKMEHVFARTNNPDEIFAVNGIAGEGKTDMYKHPDIWMFECLEDLANRADTLKNEKMFKPLCVECCFYGVHYIDKLLGADVFFQDGQWYNHYLETPVGSLKTPDWEHDELWQKTVLMTEAFLQSDQKLVLFGLPVIASVLNIAVNLYGEEILVEMLGEPELARHDLNIINDLLIKLHQWFNGVLPRRQLQPVVSWNRTQPPGYGQLCGCTNQLLSKELYAEFIAPLDDALLGVYPNGGMIHLCGSHLQHIETFAAMKNLRALQLNDKAASELEGYFKGLRDDQIIYLNPFDGMTMEQALKITGGRRIVIADNI